MRKVSKVSKAFLIIFASIFLCTVTVFATESATVIEVNDGGDNPVLFIKGIEGEVENVYAIIGNAESKANSFGKLSDGQGKINTLILIDNSISIPEEARTEINEMLLDFVASRSNNEYFSLATFSENMDTSVDFTNDYTALKGVIEGITYQDQETYLTEVLYEILKSGIFDDTAIDYNRILVISDGVDNKSVGITSTELMSLIEEKNIPIYTLGMYNRKKSNSSELENMFAISRKSGADGFLMDDLENLSIVKDGLNADREIVFVQLDVPDTEKDGGQKAISITLNAGGQEYTAKAINVQMKQVIINEEKEDNHKDQKPAEEENSVIEEPEEVEIDTTNYIGVVVIIGIVLVIAIIGLGVFLFIKKKKDSSIKSFDTLPKQNSDPWDLNSCLDDETLKLWGKGVDDNNDDATIGLFPEAKSCYITLIDLSNPGKSYKKAISNGRTIIIGRNADLSDIAIPDLEKVISKKHCQIEMRGNHFYLNDLMAPNKTYMNDTMIVSETEIYNGAILKLGKREFKVEIG